MQVMTSYLYTLFLSIFLQRIEQSSSSYKDEVINLRAELSKRTADAERNANDRSDQHQRYADLREELLRSESTTREAQSALMRSENELSRLTNDVDILRNQLNQKDADLRSTLNSLQEIQRQSLEEKYSIRAELRYTFYRHPLKHRFNINLHVFCC